MILLRHRSGRLDEAKTCARVNPALGCTDAHVPILSRSRDAVLAKVHPEP